MSERQSALVRLQLQDHGVPAKYLERAMKQVFKRKCCDHPRKCVGCQWSSNRGTNDNFRTKATSVNLAAFTASVAGNFKSRL